MMSIAVKIGHEQIRSLPVMAARAMIYDRLRAYSVPYEGDSILWGRLEVIVEGDIITWYSIPEREPECSCCGTHENATPFL